MSSKSSRKNTRRVKMDIENSYNNEYVRQKQEFNPNNGSHDKKPLVMRNKKQEEYLKLLRTKDIVFSSGCPGTGKSMIALYYAFELLDARKIEKIYVARPHVKLSGELELGSLPGDMASKLEFNMISIYDALSVFMGKGRIDYLKKSIFKPDAQIEMIPLEYLRGRSFHNSFILIDEAQNISANTMYTILSRIGENSKIAINGDLVQRDLYEKFGISGLEDSLNRLRHLPEVGHIEFTAAEIERSALAKSIIMTYLDLYE